MEKIKIAAIQMPTVADKMENVRTVKTYLEKIKDEKQDFVILPEMFCCPYQTENFPIYAEEEGGLIWQQLSAYSKTVWSLSDWGLHAGERCRRKCLQYMLCF